MEKIQKINLSFGKDHLAIPGPSNIPQRVLQAMNQPAPNIYGEEIIDTKQKVMDGIKGFANTSGSVIIYISNGHGVWEATLVNLFKEGDKILYGKYSGTEVNVAGTDYIIMRESDILAVM